MRTLGTFILFIILANILMRANVAWAAEPWDANIVYFITGGPIRAQPESVDDAAAELLSAVQADHPSTFIEVQHNSVWGDICKKIKNLRTTDKQGKTIIVGHSYGGQATVNVAYCLDEAGIPVDLAITIDPVRRPFDRDPEIIPENVAVNFNYFQKDDGLLRGRRNNRRKDGSRRGITNTQILPPFTSVPHFGIVKKLMLESDEVEQQVLSALAQ